MSGLYLKNNIIMRNVIVIFLAGMILGMAWIGFGEFQKAKATQELSKMMELRTALATELEKYYYEHQEYPNSLTNLPLANFKWGMEGATLKDLDLFSYLSRGKTFILEWHGDRNYRVYLAGTNGEMFFSKQK